MPVPIIIILHTNMHNYPQSHTKTTQAHTYTDMHIDKPNHRRTHIQFVG